jgi:thiol-disulfide isomerase/thioredoxin
MVSRLSLLVFLCLLALMPTASGRTAPSLWHGADGAVIEGRLTQVLGGLAFVAGRSANGFVPLETMTDEELRRVDAFLASAPPREPSWQNSRSPVARSLAHSLEVVRDGRLVAFEPGDRPEPAIYLAYFSASWCPPCHRFTPELIKAYQRLQALSPGFFEVVLISSDENTTAANKYMTDAGMPWLMLGFRSLGQAKPLEQWRANGIPNLVAVTRDGDVIFHSYRGTEYLGPEQVVEKCEQLLPFLQEGGPLARRARHRLAIQQYLRQVGTGSSAVQPYLLEVDDRRWSAVPPGGVELELEIDAAGKVAEGHVTDEPFSDLANLLSPAFQQWLFLPAVDHGKPVAQSVRVPLKRPAGKSS